jgi:selenocysteine lyase/cysteine desulfurase
MQCLIFIQIVQMFEDAAIRYKGSVQLAVIDHISSPSATLLPVKKIANRLRPLGVLVLVDGAHAPGQGMQII